MEKEENRRYLVDHIGHDKTNHYPALVNGLSPYVNDKGKLAELRQGMELVWTAKNAFYTELGQEFGWILSAT